MGTISAVLMFINVPLPFLPPYLRLDISDLPALIAGIMFNPFAGVAVLVIKNLLHLLLTAIYDPIGAAANLLAGLLLVFPVSFLFYKYKSKKSVLIGVILGTVLMTTGMSVLNYYVILPAYSMFMGWEEMTDSVKQSTVLAGIMPFNLIKGIFAGTIFYLIFLRLRKWIEKKRTI
ncbi:ECF transporter S component [Gracilibacillus oryzae]|uniref:Riboflavin transporter n=2 Tax=Gracilibacillus oryzae TaxID=1672701 RepID=A0A7C8KRS9_9BACI|nr:ECF transporter S component [Gracilibacillus oryzae]